jgi:hypothetical protein
VVVAVFVIFIGIPLYLSKPSLASSVKFSLAT